MSMTAYITPMKLESGEKVSRSSLDQLCETGIDVKRLIAEETFNIILVHDRQQISSIKGMPTIICTDDIIEEVDGNYSVDNVDIFNFNYVLPPFNNLELIDGTLIDWDNFIEYRWHIVCDN